jgi:hypothetical protein
MIRLRLALELDYDIAEPGCDFIFNIHAAHTDRQRVVREQLTLSQEVQPLVETDPATRNRHLRLQALAGLRTAPPSICRTTSPSRAESPRFRSRACLPTC